MDPLPPEPSRDAETLRPQHGEWKPPSNYPRTICWSDGDDWPCRVIRALDALAELRTQAKDNAPTP